MNPVIRISENDPRYAEMIGTVKEAMKPENLIIVARSERNKKSDEVSPFLVKNGIYFYVAYRADGYMPFVKNPTAEQILRAKLNTFSNAVVGSMLDVMFGTCGKLADYSGDITMVCVTNESNMHGAGILACPEFWNEAKRKFGNFYILPSSVHEVILTTIGDSQEELSQMVNFINGSDVITDDDFLSNNAFSVDDWM